MWLYIPSSQRDHDECTVSNASTGADGSVFVHVQDTGDESNLLLFSASVISVSHHSPALSLSSIEKTGRRVSHPRRRGSFQKAIQSHSQTHQTEPLLDIDEIWNWLKKSRIVCLAKSNTSPDSMIGQYRLYSSDILSKSTPNLTAILNRNARKSFSPSLPTAQAADDVDYRPSSTRSFLARLSTFKLSTYSNKPKPINAVSAACCGWMNDVKDDKSTVKDRLRCGICGATWVVKDTTGMNRDAAATLVERQRVSLVGMHKDGCPWKTRQCDGMSLAMYAPFPVN